MLKFPYGLMNFATIRMENNYFVDQTAYIKKIEDFGRYLFMLRPRRFGKSLWLNILYNYYDINQADKFDQLFGDLQIGQNPTELHNQYLVLQFDFSKIDIQADIEQIQNNFHDYCNDTLLHFFHTNKKYFSRAIDINKDNCISSLNKTINVATESEQKLYVLIDEYDNFVNELIVKNRDQEYYDLVTGEGLLKTFFKVLKDGTKTSVDRIFITGVSPIMMSDLSSAFNIAEDIFLQKRFNSMMGFTEEDVENILEKTLLACKKPELFAQSLEMMRYYYNGYCFSEDSDELIYNPTLVLYFVKNLLDTGKYPGMMLDPNLDMDISKLDYIAKLSSGQKRIFEIQYKHEQVAASRIIPRFKLKELMHLEKKNEDYIWSFLYYHGMLTIKDSFGLGVNLKIPNSVSKIFYYERIRDLLFPQPVDLVEIHKAFFLELDIDKYCDFMERNMLSILSNRDYLQATELTYKVMFLTVMYRDDMYIIDSEPEILRQYCDLLYLARADTREKYGLLDILIEFKFINLAEMQMRGEQLQNRSRTELMSHPKVIAKLEQAKEQLAKYKQILEKKHQIKLRTIALVGIGFDRIVGVEY